MDDAQLKHEKAVGDAFIEWYNKHEGANFAFQGRPENAPDLTYRDGDRELMIEIGDSYYDDADAMMKWKSARKDPTAPRLWQGVNFEVALVENINKLLKDKAAKDYGEHCILLVNVLPTLTTADDMEGLLPGIEIPSSHFEEIYLTGDFAQSNAASGGYRCWKIA